MSTCVQAAADKFSCVPHDPHHRANTREGCAKCDLRFNGHFPGELGLASVY